MKKTIHKEHDGTSIPFFKSQAVYASGEKGTPGYHSSYEIFFFCRLSM